MALIKDLYRHERTKYWFGFGGPKKDELKKQRNTRHTVLKSCLPLSALLCFAKLMVSVFSWAMTENADVCLNYPSDDHFRSRFRAVLGVQVPCMVLAALQAWNFLIVWHRKNHSIRRSLLVAAGDSVLIILSAVNVSLVESMRAAAPSAEDIIEEFPDLERDHRATYLERRLTRSFPSQSIAFLSLVCVDVAIHVSAMAFWHWLLPPVWRFPEHYEPVIREGKGKKDVFEMVRGSSSQVELVEQQSTEASNDQTSLAALFWEQEGKKLRANSRQSAEVRTES